MARLPGLNGDVGTSGAGLPNRMKLLLITADFPPVRSGEASHSYHLGQQLARRGVDVHVLTSAIPGVVHPPGVTVHPLMRGWGWGAVPRLRSFLKRTAPDGVLLLLLMDMYDNHPMVTFAPLLARSVLPSVRFVTQVEHLAFTHHWDLSFPTRLVRKALVTWWDKARGANSLYGTLLRDSDHLIVLSGTHLDQLAELNAAVRHKTTVIPPAPIMSETVRDEATARTLGRAALGVGPEEFLFINYGYLYPGKGLETLLRALHLLVRHRPAVRLAVVGGALEHPYTKNNSVDSHGYVRLARALCDNLGLGDRVIWTGPCPTEGEQASLYLRAADACVLPFDQGMFLNNSTFAAAVTHGLPVVTTRGSSVEAPFRDGENLMLCPPRDPVALATALEKMVQDDGLRRRIRAGALSLARECFSWDRVIERTLHVFNGHRAADGQAPALAAS